MYVSQRYHNALYGSQVVWFTRNGMEPGSPPIVPTSIAPTSNELRIASTDMGARDSQAPVRMDVRRLARLVFYALILPGGSAIVFDFWLGLFPLLTLGTMVVVFPIAAFIILRSTLREMKNVIDQVAPEEVAPEDADVISDGFVAEAESTSAAGADPGRPSVKSSL
ncbi:MAG: hypothetical protein WDZ49_07000 [Litorilinea sp.]